MTNYYGIYLIPPPEIAYPLSLGQSALAKEFGGQTAVRFMVHCTIKGFTKIQEGTLDTLVQVLDDLFARTSAFDTALYRPWVSGGTEDRESLILWMPKAEPILTLHRQVWERVGPHVATDCLFTPVEPALERFAPHVTLLQGELPSDPSVLDSAKLFAEHILTTLPSHTFVARDLQLIEFTSNDWAGAWWETLRFKQLRAWRLAEK